MAETFKCPHCGAVYEIRHDKAVSEDNRLAHCEVCGKQMGGHAAIKLTAGPRRSFDEVEGVENMRATFPELAPSARIDALEKERARQRLNQDIYGARPCRSGPDLKSRWSCPRAA